MAKKKIPISDEMRAYFAAIGRKGGSVKSPAKQRSSRRNFKKGREIAAKLRVQNGDAA